MQGPCTVSVPISGDTFLRDGHPNKNQGDWSVLRVRRTGHNRALVRVDATEIDAVLSGAVLVSATLELSISDTANNWGPDGRTLDIHELTAGWTENEATWNCAIDSDTGNQQPDCDGATDWHMEVAGSEPWEPQPTDTQLITSNQTGTVVFDVTSSIAGGAPGHGWIIKKSDEGENGRVEFASRETATPPILILTYEGPGCGACLCADPVSLGLWHFDEGEGTSAADSSGNAIDGTLIGSPSWTDGPSAFAGSALSFDDAEDLVSLGRSVPLQGPFSQLTLEAWVYPTSFSNLGDVLAGGFSGPRIISSTEGSGWSLGHAPGAGNIQVELRGVANGVFILPTSFPLDAWSHVGVTYDGAEVKTYLDGALIDSRTAQGLVSAGDVTFIGNEASGLARQTNGNFAWQGVIDEVALYERALSAEEIAAHVQACSDPDDSPASCDPLAQD